MMLQVIEACPGVTVRALQARLAFQWSSFYLHLRRLEAEGLVRVEPDPLDGRMRRIFSGSAPSPTAPEPRAPHLILRGTALALARLLVDRPGMDLREAAEALDESPRTVHYHLKRLADAGLVLSSSDTRYRDLRATESLLRILDDAASILGADDANSPAERS